MGNRQLREETLVPDRTSCDRYSSPLDHFIILSFTFQATLNQAARHRNVYLDSMGADPYGK